MHSGNVPWHRSMLCGTAEISQVPYLIEGLKPFRAEIVPQLRQLLQQPDLDEKERLRLSLAMVAEDEGQVAYLYDRLLSAEPAELLVIRDGAAAATATSWWPDCGWTAEDPAAAKDRRFRALCALAAFDPASPRWANAGKPAAETLVAENPLLAAAWVEALRPVRQSLLPALQAVFRDRERATCRAVVGDAASWPTMPPTSPDVLADLLMDADEKQFAIIYAKLKKHGEDGLPILQAEMDEKPVPRRLRGSKRSIGKATS